jgi:predicted nuclease of restriction endonuclease-like (RecB) superfamily
METNASDGNSSYTNEEVSREASDAEGLTQKQSTITNQLLEDIRALINQAQQRVARVVNSELVILNWHVGERIRKEILGQERAEYGKQIVVTLSRQLTVEYGRGFTRDAIFRMIQFVERFPNLKTVTDLSQQLSWSHFVELIVLEEALKRDFYAEMCRVERWSVRTLRDKIRSMLYERTAISRKPEKLAQQELEALRSEGQMTPDLVFRDPYLLNFLGLADTYSERDLETTILREIEQFLLELGTDFTFVARQKRLTIGREDFYLDLLFFHRSLRRLVAIELKLGRFSAAYKGQMELYLRWLDKYERKAWEESPIGLILCSEKDQEQIELLQLDQGEIRVAEYLTELPPQPVLEAKLHEAVRLARERMSIEPKNSTSADNDSVSP